MSFEAVFLKLGDTGTGLNLTITFDQLYNRNWPSGLTFVTIEKN